MTPTPDDLTRLPDDELNNDDLGDELELDEAEVGLDDLPEQIDEAGSLLADEPDLAELEEIEAEDEEEDTAIELETDLGDDPVRIWNRSASS